MYKTIGILGSTGSIGTQTLDIVRKNADLRVCCLAVNKNIDLLESQIREFKPDIAAVYDTEKGKELATRVADTDCKIVYGRRGLLEASTFPGMDILVTAIVGMIGIEPTVAAITEGIDIALANKETLVCAGEIIMKLARANKVRILPVDSEHSAIFQCLEESNEIEKILLTCSGGPFRGKTKSEMMNVTVKEALAHPTWSMGKKITVDCATLVNKGLEVIEATHLFNVTSDQVQVVIHPQSIVHSMVQFKDSAVKAQLGTPDMRLPIEYALFYPERRGFGGSELDFWNISDLHFEKPDTDVFEGLALAYRALEIGGSMPALFNAANEIAVSDFLQGKITFTNITEYIRCAMDKHNLISDPDIEDIMHIKEELI